jgi:hypothetical protein
MQENIVQNQLTRRAIHVLTLTVDFLWFSSKFSDAKNIRIIWNKRQPGSQHFVSTLSSNSFQSPICLDDTANVLPGQVSISKIFGPINESIKLHEHFPSISIFPISHLHHYNEWFNHNTFGSKPHEMESL